MAYQDHQRRNLSNDIETDTSGTSIHRSSSIGQVHEPSERAVKPMQERETRMYGVDSDSPERLENDIRRTRSAMDETLDQLGEKLQPKHLVDEAWSWAYEQLPERSNLKETISNTGKRLSRKVSQHPIPAALVGVGMIWLLSEETTGKNVSTGDIRRGMERAGERTRDAASSVKEGVSRAGSRIGEKASDLGSKAKDRITNIGSNDGSPSYGSPKTPYGSTSTYSSSSYSDDSGIDPIGKVSEMGSHAAQRTTESMRRAADATAQAYEEKPLLFGLLAMAGGIAAGLALPNTRAERRAFGEAGQRIRDEAAEIGHEYGEEAAQRASEKVRDLTNTAKSKAEDALDKVEAKARESSDSSGADDAESQNPTSSTTKSETTSGTRSGGTGNSF